jgi:acetyl-CoA carboxylase carboxyl transferase subunit alpha
MVLIDEIIPEPLGGAHFDRETTFENVQKAVLGAFEQLKGLSTQELINQRMEKYCNMGVYNE